jgi:hypothetical protein
MLAIAFWSGYEDDDGAIELDVTVFCRVNSVSKEIVFGIEACRDRYAIWEVDSGSITQLHGMIEDGPRFVAHNGHDLIDEMIGGLAESALFFQKHLERKDKL